MRCCVEGCDREGPVNGRCRSHFAQELGRRPKTEQQKARMSAAALGKPKSAAARAAMSAAKKGVSRPQTDVARAKVSAARKGKRLSPAHREKLSGRNSVHWGQPPKHKPRVSYRGIAFRSTWEVRAAQYLDTKGIAWEYEKHRFDLGECTYLPDFYLPETQVFWEVKGWLDARSQRKTQLFREQNPDTPLVLVTKSVLQLMRA